ncbi:hypothetical protein MF672_010740 [Actinomadura sp. ATCC 31491]|uniref:Uncharacterized protein n=1 Tax=Actinomadura luzonensis TaxID=2805427 RepID=A0ABT0FQ49_9ACTN|nr:hypothetical protein [Actinomadura luzonensis]MCK2214263.1 hypothetical protein [Actinomadura luzonensis]
MTDTTTTAALPDELAAAVDGLTAYRLTAGLRLVDRRAFLELRCPHAIEQPGPVTVSARTCVTNLLGEQARTRPVDLLALFTAALFHHDAQPSLERTARFGALDRRLGELASYAVHVDVDDDPFLVLGCPYRGGRCPTSEDGECCVNIIPAEQQATIDLGAVLQLAKAHENARYGVPRDPLEAFRRSLVERQRGEIFIRETSDGSSAGLASAYADLLGRIIGDFDRAVNGA